MKQMKLDTNKVLEYFQEYLDGTKNLEDKTPKMLEARIGKRAAEMFIDGMAAMIAQSNVKGIVDNALQVAQFHGGGPIK